jgi:hypothetical protein
VCFKKTQTPWAPVDELASQEGKMAWLSKEEHCKGRLADGYFADLAVLNADYFSIEEDEIRGIESVLTMVGGKPVYATEEFSPLAPLMPPVSPDWSPVAHYGGYDNS